MRNIVWERLLSSFPPGSVVLDMGCGPGIDTAFMAQNGISVVATDISPGMIDVTRKKVERFNLHDSVKTRVVKWEDINSLADEFGKESFDGILSNFGSLNCVKDLRPLSQNCARLLKTNGIMFANIMNRFCLWESAYYTLKGRFREALRRSRKDGLPVKLASHDVITYYHFPEEFKGFFNKEFRAKHVLGLGIFLPPPYLEEIYNQYKGMFSWVKTVERLSEDKFPFYNMADHVLLELEKI
jgi:2-polyprenyl-3-methyl-5-hydroxy-6-metoxy-1,4-benzoquinol methylase